MSPAQSPSPSHSWRWRYGKYAIALITLLLVLSAAKPPRRLLKAKRRAAHAPRSEIAAPPWSPPALDPALARCIRDSSPRYRAFIDAQRDVRKPPGGTLCNQCISRLFLTWGQVVAHNPSLNPLEVLDIGGNRGATALAFLEAFPAPTVVRSFEMDPTTCAMLRASHDSLSNAADRARWHVTCEGVAAERGAKEFFSGGAGSPLSSLGRLNTLHENLRPGGLVNITTVVDIFERHDLAHVGFVKIDVEGWEREVIQGMDLATNAPRIDALLFEHGETWIDTRKGPSSMSLANVVEGLSEVGGGAGYACFLVGTFDLLPISPPWVAPIESDIVYAFNVLCLRRDAPIHRELLLSHRQELDHCLAGQGLWGY